MEEMLDRGDVLKTALEITYGERNRSYGDPRDNHATIALLSSIITGKYITADDVAVIQISLKLSREKVAGKSDNQIDLAAYSAIREELKDRTPYMDMCDAMARDYVSFQTVPTAEEQPAQCDGNAKNVQSKKQARTSTNPGVDFDGKKLRD